MLTPEQIRRLYRDEDAATSDEARETAESVKNDPDQARRMLLVLYVLAGEDAQFNELLSLVVRVGSMQLIAMAAHEDDDFAKRMGELIIEGMERIAKINTPTPRGKVKKAKSA